MYLVAFYSNRHASIDLDFLDSDSRKCCLCTIVYACIASKLKNINNYISFIHAIIDKTTIYISDSEFSRFEEDGDYTLYNEEELSEIYLASDNNSSENE